jgi:hypothetical protein
LQVAFSTRGGFDGDVGGYAGDPESVDACHSENGVEFGAVEPAGRLSPDERFTGLGARSSMISTAGVPSSRQLQPASVRNSGEFGLIAGSPG